MLETLIGNMMLGLTSALTPTSLLYCALGVTLGTAIGMIPGIGTLATMSMLFPFTFYLDPLSALIMLAGIYYGAAYGGSTASILLNLPGTPSNAVTCLDGYPMARQGRAGVALFVTTIASFIGGTTGILILMLFSPVIVAVAMNFSSQEYFSLMVMGLMAATLMSPYSPVKGIAMVVLGVVLGLVGMDVYTGAQRFTFGLYELMDGISLVALAMGLFGVSEIIVSIRSITPGEVDRKITLRSMLPTREDFRRSVPAVLRGTGIGVFFGALPGTGGTVAAFLSYVAERKLSSRPEEFGKGAIEGIAGPEAANNSADQTSFAPTLTLGIPGSAPMALILGVLIIHGIVPGPTMINTQPEMFWGLIMSFWVGNVLLLFLNIPLIGLWIRILLIPYKYLYPSILMFIGIGVYTTRNSVFDVLCALAFGVFGYLMRVFHFPAAPLLLGFVLGPLMEEHFRRAMLMSGGSFRTFVDRPLSLAFLCLTGAAIAWLIWSAAVGSIRKVRQRSA